MTTLVDLTTGQVLGSVDGRDSAAVGQWLTDRSQQWRDGVEVVAIDPSAAFRKALGEHLRRLLDADTLAQAWEERMRLGHYVQLARMPETDRLYDTIVTWWQAIEVLIVTGATTAKSPTPCSRPH